MNGDFEFFLNQINEVLLRLSICLLEKAGAEDGVKFSDLPQSEKQRIAGEIGFQADLSEVEEYRMGDLGLTLERLADARECYSQHLNEFSSSLLSRFN